MRLLIPLLLPLTLHAAIYRWTDERGVIHYGATAPPQGQLIVPVPAQGFVFDSPAIAVPPRPPRGENRQLRAWRDQQARCAKLARQIRRIEQRLRAGYTEPTGNRLRARRRELSRSRFHDCR